MVHFAYMPSPIPRQVRWKFVRSYIPSTSAFPETGAGRLLHHYFRGLLSVPLPYGLHARQVAFAPLCTRGFSGLVASTAALIATGWSEPVPGRVYPRCGPAPSRRTRLARDSGTEWWRSSALETERPHLNPGFPPGEGSIPPLPPIPFPSSHPHPTPDAPHPLSSSPSR